jgi:hypothetical protein
MDCFWAAVSVILGQAGLASAVGIGFGRVWAWVRGTVKLFWGGASG